VGIRGTSAVERVLVAVLVATVLGGCVADGGSTTVGPGAGVSEPVASDSEQTGSEPTDGETPPATVSPPVVAPVGSALAALRRLPVKGRAPRTGYSRSEFGQAWADVDRNGCDTRNDVLRRDLTVVVLKPGTHGCTVLTGVLHDPYTGQTVLFVRGVGTSLAVQIDHVVALGDAWQKGAQSLTLERRTAMANDPLELLAVKGAVNQQKGDGDAATWLPPRKAYRCAYVARQVAVKERYRLWVTPAERDAMARVLSTCPRQPLPAS
jgi:hypothetical protein